jgi:hypothetical protein
VQVRERRGADDLLGGEAEQAPHGGARVDDARVAVDDLHDVGRVLAQAAVVLLARAQPALGVLAVGDVADEGDELAVALRHDARLVVARAVLGLDPVLGPRQLAGAARAREGVVEARARVVGEQVAQRAPMTCASGKRRAAARPARRSSTTPSSSRRK